MIDCKQSTYPVRKIALLIIYQSVMRKNFLWNQELLFSILLSPPYPQQHGLKEEEIGLQ